MVRNVFWPHKDYNSFLGGKLRVFKLYNYTGYGKSCDFYGCFGLFFLFVKLILLSIIFYRTISVMHVYFIVYALFSYL
jgi:hypothetical protein